MYKIPVYQPILRGNEKKYVNECLESSWISSKGSFVRRFEEAFAAYTGAPHAVSVCNGTAALHLALIALGIGVGDEVVVPTLTYVASANAISYTGAIPVFVDSLPDTWQMDPREVAKKITSRTKAIMAVHLYGHPCDLDSLLSLCQAHRLFLIEDCAEAFGTFYKGRHVGTFGEVGAFSFFGNKTITTGEGGMVICRKGEVHQQLVLYKGQGVNSAHPYWHEVVGYNYRMTNICAAIGYAQLEQAEWILKQKKFIALEYEKALKNLPIQCHKPIGDVVHSHWMCSILVNNLQLRDALRDYLAEAGVETRPFFYPLHCLPIYKQMERYPVAEVLSERGINLPSYPALSLRELQEICNVIQQFYLCQKPYIFSGAEVIAAASPTSI